MRGGNHQGKEGKGQHGHGASGAASSSHLQEVLMC